MKFSPYLKIIRLRTLYVRKKKLTIDGRKLI
jgi:hypothetical protein